MTAKECPESGTRRSLKSTLALWAGRIALIAIGVVARRISRAKFGLYHPDHAVFLEERTESGRPTPSMRFRTATPMAASVC
jgi:hypothetical protein